MKQTLTAPEWKDVNIHWSLSDPPSLGSVKSASNFLKLLFEYGHATPTDADRGYWPTVCFMWEGNCVELEVFDGSFELQIHSPNGLFDVVCFDETKPNEMSDLLETFAKHIGSQSSSAVKSSTPALKTP